MFGFFREVIIEICSYAYSMEPLLSVKFYVLCMRLAKPQSNPENIIQSK